MINRNGQVIAEVLSKVAQAVRQLDESEIETFLAGDFRVEFVLETQANRRNKNSRNLNVDVQKDISEVAELLRNLDDRDQGRALLEQRVPNKNLLTHLARYLDLPLQKREPVDRLKEKIIEATIGYRLRSRAIRGTDRVEKTA
jgi:hypothetical protein